MSAVNPSTVTYNQPGSPSTDVGAGSGTVMEPPLPVPNAVASRLPGAESTSGSADHTRAMALLTSDASCMEFPSPSLGALLPDTVEGEGTVEAGEFSSLGFAQLTVMELVPTETPLVPPCT